MSMQSAHDHDILQLKLNHLIRSASLSTTEPVADVKAIRDDIEIDHDLDPVDDVVSVVPSTASSAGLPPPPPPPPVVDSSPVFDSEADSRLLELIHENEPYAVASSQQASMWRTISNQMKLHFDQAMTPSTKALRLSGRICQNRFKALLCRHKKRLQGTPLNYLKVSPTSSRAEQHAQKLLVQIISQMDRFEKNQELERQERQAAVAAAEIKGPSSSSSSGDMRKQQPKAQYSKSSSASLSLHNNKRPHHHHHQYPSSYLTNSGNHYHKLKLKTQAQAQGVQESYRAAAQAETKRRRMLMNEHQQQQHAQHQERHGVVDQNEDFGVEGGEDSPMDDDECGHSYRSSTSRGLLGSWRVDEAELRREVKPGQVRKLYRRMKALAGILEEYLALKRLSYAMDISEAGSGSNTHSGSSSSESSSSPTRDEALDAGTSGLHDDDQEPPGGGFNHQNNQEETIKAMLNELFHN